MQKLSITVSAGGSSSIAMHLMSLSIFVWSVVVMWSRVPGWLRVSADLPDSFACCLLHLPYLKFCLECNAVIDDGKGVPARIQEFETFSAVFYAYRHLIA